LGPLDVTHKGDRLDVGTAKQRAVLAALLVSANEALSVDRLMAFVWWSSPAAAASNLRLYLSGLRRVLHLPGESGSRLHTLRAAGYQLHVLPGELDLDRFNDLVEQGEQRLRVGLMPAAANYFERALRTCRGRILDGVSGGPALQAKVTMLEERRMSVAERWAELRLQLRQPHDVVTQLRAFASEHPLRERLWGYLMIALCRCGRPGEALAAYAEVRGTLARELGTDPGPELQYLYKRILRSDDGLAPVGSQAYQNLNGVHARR
jgi:DNA-binding SARP family transcriptional activator